VTLLQRIRRIWGRIGLAMLIALRLMKYVTFMRGMSTEAC
jgi:hypothetical protein